MNTGEAHHRARRDTKAASWSPAVQLLRAEELDEPHLSRWRELQALASASGACQLANPFLAPEFTLGVSALHDDVRVAVLTGRRPGDTDGPLSGPPIHDGAAQPTQALGYFPFQRGRFGVGSAIGLGLSDCQGLVHHPGISFHAKELLRSCGLVSWEFDHLADGTDGHGPLITRGAAVAKPHPSPIVEVDQGYETYLARLRIDSPKFTRTTLAKQRKLGRDVAELRYVHDERDPRMLRTLMDWKSAQYRRTGRSDRFARPWIVELVEQLFQERSTSFAGLLSVLYAGEQPVAAHFGLRSRETLACWFPVYDPAFAKYSPGLALHLRMAEGAAATGLARLDLGRGAKEYKDSLKTDEITVYEGRVTRRHPAAVGHLVGRAPVRALREAVVSHPELYRPADRLLKRWGRIRSGGG